MSIYILKAHAKPSFFTLEFGTYNEAMAYARKMADAGPSRPYKTFKGSALPLWAVTVRKPQVERSRAIYERFDSLPGYLNWSQHIAPKANIVTVCEQPKNVENIHYITCTDSQNHWKANAKTDRRLQKDTRPYKPRQATGIYQ